LSSTTSTCIGSSFALPTSTSVITCDSKPVCDQSGCQGDTRFLRLRPVGRTCNLLPVLPAHPLTLDCVSTLRLQSSDNCSRYDKPSTDLAKKYYKIILDSLNLN
jgi:hypothetical protein